MSELEQQAYVFGTLFTLANKLQVLGDQFDPGITIKQWLFLVCVSKFGSPPTVSEVASAIGYSRQNAKRIASTLQSSGYVVIRRDESDARALRIELTGKCTAYFHQRYEREIEFLTRVFAGFDVELTLGLFEGVSKLEQNIVSMTAQDGNQALE